MSGLDRRLEPEGTVRRFEVIDGAVGRRRWSADDRARILEETFVPGAVVSVVARRHGLTPQQLFTWRREARQTAALPAFVPAVTAPEPTAVDPARAQPPRRRIRRSSSRRRAVGIEVEAGGITVRIGDGASPTIIAAVIGALKGGA
ncbi:transposase [Methylobacterium sp. 13MFTsu3.1M2]|uniref:IS66-like element accessory protein TnpA n=2 Tax=Methylobacterium sp. 13MFTsu3.1M2 TaxID=1502776 RepID=UPI0008E87A51|nr:transposase [Methylobacterium sp. 13MFTsu3.1M2]SFF20078.1 transposase [Methylobacterium sp. 13MFTsu3.1M2]